MSRLKTVAITALAALLAPALFAMDTTQNAPMTNPAVPGTLNYVEGSARLDGQRITQSAIGSASADLRAGQVLSTSDSRAEVLLTPGVFLRLGHNSRVKMLSPDLTDTAMAVERGRVDVEVDQLFPQNDIHILVDHVPVQLVKTGIYEFNARRGTVMVLKGMAVAMRPNDKWVKVKDGHELNVADLATAKPRKFDEAELEQTGLYRWSSLRSDYLAEDNQQMAGEYGYGYGYGPGWYWDPYAFDYTFLGPYGFDSPFGWGFYPMGWGGGWGYPGYFGGYGYYGGGYYGNGGRLHRPLPMPGHSSLARPSSGFRGGAFRSGGEMGGFHGGGGFGGFHGGGGGGGHGR